MFDLDCTPENAPKFLEWLSSRGGIAVWRSVDLSDPSWSCSTPALTPDGQPYEKPHWKADSKPEKIVTDPSKIQVLVAVEVKRFHVAVRRGSQGFSLKLTDASSRKVEKAVAAAGSDAFYCFDYMTQDAVILVPDPGSSKPLSEWGSA